MREVVGIAASYVLYTAFIVAFLAWAVEAAARGKAIEAAIVSPIACFGLLLGLVKLAKIVGWIEL